jgi:solute carrier family 10 (sodium/bile acid cotransporter), member 7
MSKEQAVAVCFCGAAKTTSLGIPMVSAMWSQADNKTQAELQIPVLLYTIEQVRISPVHQDFSISLGAISC